jgi:uncharacterized protein YndB with AHSA1/START domain
MINPIDNDAISIEVIINAPIEKVWKAWTDPAWILKWFGSDPNGQGIKAKMNVHNGGKYEITFKDSDGTEHTCMGVYIDVKELHSLSFTWEWKNEPGVVSFVSVLLKPGTTNTQMEFRHSKLGTASRHDYLNGWNATFLKLNRINFYP